MVESNAKTCNSLIEGQSVARQLVREREFDGYVPHVVKKASKNIHDMKQERQ